MAAQLMTDVVLSTLASSKSEEIFDFQYAKEEKRMCLPRLAGETDSVWGPLKHGRVLVSKNCQGGGESFPDTLSIVSICLRARGLYSRRQVVNKGCVP